MLAELGIAAVSGLANYFANQSAADRAEALQNKALQEWIKIHIPNPEEQKLALKQFVVQGTLAPKLEQAIQADPSAFKNIVVDSSNKIAQNRALSELEGIGNNGGLRLQDKAAIQEAQQEGISRDRGNRLAISDSMARRGLGGSGFDAASQLQAQQSGADRDSQNSLSIAAKAQDRALQAITGAGDMATKNRAQDFDEQAQKASAEDRINMFNTNNLRDVQSRNIASQNRDAELNLNEQQNVADQNTKTTNAEQEYNKGLMQKQFDNQTKVASGKSGVYTGLSNNAIQQGQNTGNLFTNAGQAIGGAVNSANRDKFWDKYFRTQKKGYDPELDEV